MLSQKIIDQYTAILIDELRPAMGCTEPIAIAYAASIVTDVLGGAPESISIELSGNIIKNVKSVVVPATGGMHGIESAVAAGVISASPDKKLEVLSVLGEEDHVAHLDFHGGAHAGFGHLAGAAGHDLALGGLFLSGIGDEQTASGLFFGLKALHENTIIQGLHYPYPPKCFDCLGFPPREGGGFGALTGASRERRLIDKPSFPIEKGSGAIFFVFFRTFF